MLENSSKTITKIEVQKRNKERVNIYIDGEYALACSAELIYLQGLKTGKKIEVGILENIANEDNYIKCKNAALKTIEKSYKTENEVTTKLIDKGYDDKTIKRTIVFLKEYGFLDDLRYVDMYIKEKLITQGRNKIKFSLIKKGIHEDLIKDKLSLISGELEFNTALKLAEKKQKLLVKSEQDERKIHKKIYEYLIRNGYNSSVVQDVLNSLDKVNVSEETETEKDIDLEELYNIAEKRFRVITKSEDDQRKIYKKLFDYLYRRSYSYDDIKGVLNEILKKDYSDYEE